MTAPGGGPDLAAPRLGSSPGGQELSNMEKAAQISVIVIAIVLTAAGLRVTSDLGVPIVFALVVIK